MKNVHPCLRVLTLLVFMSFLGVATAQAQATRTWVSGVGDDVNPCSRTAPCKTFAGAISKTFTNGEINCLDPGGFGAVTITKSLTIDCHEVFASILASGTTGIIINVLPGNANDPRRTVRLRNLNISGVGASGSVGTNTGLKGIRIDSAAAVFIEDSLVEGFTQQGILDRRTTGGELSISNTTVRNCNQTGILVQPLSGSTRIDAVLDNVRVLNNDFGFAISNGVRAQVNQSLFSQNTNGGLYADSLVGNSELNVNGSVSSSNGTGVQNGGGSTIIRLSDMNIFANGTALFGATFTFGTNRISGNTMAGTLPTVMGGDSHAKGTQ